MKISVFPGRLCGTVQAVSSKSYAHRALISASFLSDSPVKIYGKFNSSDVIATVNCLKTLGADIKITESYAYVVPVKRLPAEAVLDVKESASTYRFMLPIVSLLNVKTKFILGKSLSNRPIAPLLEALAPYETKAEGGFIYGGKVAEKVVIDQSLSSQFVSGLMFALSVACEKSEIVINGKRVSQSYVDMTADVLNAFGVCVTKTENGYIIEKRIASISEYFVEGDWSGATFFLCAGAIGGKISVGGLNAKTLQGDCKILDALKDFGAKIEVKGDTITVEKGERLPFSFDAENCPDAVPALAVLGAYAEGTTIIKNVSRLRIKESDRIRSIEKLLSSAKIKTQRKNDDLYVYGGKVYGVNFTSDDHRMIMASAILSAYAEGTSIIEDVKAVDKSYPQFFEDFKNVGGSFSVDMEG